MNTFEKMIIQWYPTGSQYICNPPVLDTDKDTVFLVHNLQKAYDFLIADGWDDCGKEYELDEFKALRRGKDNYIVTDNHTFFMSYVKATNAAKSLNLLNKEDRIKLFIAVLSEDSGYFGTSGIWSYAEEDLFG